MSIVEDLRGELIRLLDGVSKKPLTEDKYFRAIDRGDGAFLSFPDEIALAYLRAVRMLRESTENAGVKISDAQLEELLNDWLFEVKYGDESEVRQHIDKYVVAFLDKIRSVRDRSYLFLFPIMHMRLDEDLVIGDSRIVNLTEAVLRGLGSTYSVRVAFGDDPVKELTDRNETSTFAVVVVQASDYKKALEMASEKADMCLNVLRLYNSSAPFVLREELRQRIAQEIVWIESDRKAYGENMGSVNEVVNVPVINAHAIQEMKNHGLDIVGDLMRRDPNTLTGLEQDILAAIFWFGSAVKDPIRRTSFIKSVVGLETLLVPDGGHGKGARLAKRFASIIYSGDSENVKREVYREMSKLYGVRNSVLHSGEGYVHDDDLHQAIAWTQTLIQFLLKHTGKFQSILNLLQQKFPVDDTIYGDKTEPELDEIKDMVGSALTKLQDNDSQLFEENVNERSITHKLAEYLQQEFAGWNVDCEYNRNLGKIKELRVPKEGVRRDDLESHTVFPDIIVHRRGTKDNLLVIEAKKSNSTVSDEIDKSKLRAYREEPFNYKFGLFIKFDVGRGRGKPRLEWFTPSLAS